MSLLRLRAEFLLFVIGAYVILNHGFMLLRLPPTGFGVPIGELIVLLFGATFVFELRRLPAFVYAAPITPLLIWWGVGFTRLIFDAEQHGLWAMRDASHMIDSLFLWVGFVAASVPAFMDRFSTWLRTCLNIGVVYSLCFPFRDALMAISPQLSAPAGYTAALLFNYTSASMVPLTAAMAWLVDKKRILGLSATLLAGALIVYCVVIFQMRTTYLQVMILLAALMAVQPRIALRMWGALAFGSVLLVAMLLLDIRITGRLGEAFSLDFFTQHFAAIWGAKSDGIIGSASSGVDQRLAWWAEIWRGLNESLPKLLFGLGYGIPLTDFATVGGVVVREPHNSVMSMLGRTGIVGLAAFAWVQIALLGKWIRVYRWCRANGEKLWENNMLILGVFFLLMWVYSLGEDAFEKPFNAIPYYFLWGVILRASFSIAQAERQAREAIGSNDLK